MSQLQPLQFKSRMSQFPLVPIPHFKTKIAPCSEKSVCDQRGFRKGRPLHLWDCWQTEEWKFMPFTWKRLGSATVKSKQERKDSEIRTAASKFTDNLVLYPIHLGWERWRSGGRRWGIQGQSSRDTGNPVSTNQETHKLQYRTWSHPLIQSRFLNWPVNDPQAMQGRY